MIDESLRGPRVRVQTLSLVILLGLGAVALTLAYWAFARAAALAGRDDNPRRVEAELRIQRGRILDTNGVVLAETVGSPDRLDRFYPVATIGPAVGYYSFRHGTAGIEAGLDAILRGEDEGEWERYQRQLLHSPLVGRDVRLTLDATWQQAADALMGDRPGALLLMSLPDAEIRAMVSHPGYDPNRLDDDFAALLADERAPLVNRVTQGQYQPGLALQPFLMAVAADDGLIDLAAEVEGGERAITYGRTTLRCADPAVSPGLTMTWAEVLRRSCTAPLFFLADDFGPDRLLEGYDAFSLTVAPDLPIDLVTPPAALIEDPFLAMIGQENLTVSPLQMGLALAGLVNDGRLPRPRLVAAIQDKVGVWQPFLPSYSVEEGPAVAPATAQAILQAMAEYEGVREHSALALSGPGDGSLGWYLGLSPATSPRLLVVVVVEGALGVAEGQAIGRALLTRP